MRLTRWMSRMLAGGATAALLALAMLAYGGSGDAGKADWFVATAGNERAEPAVATEESARAVPAETPAAREAGVRRVRLRHLHRDRVPEA